MPSPFSDVNAMLWPCLKADDPMPFRLKSDLARDNWPLDITVYNVCKDVPCFGCSYPPVTSSDSQGSHDSGSVSPGAANTPRTERKFLGLSLGPFGGSHSNASLESLQQQFMQQQASHSHSRSADADARTRSLLAIDYCHGQSLWYSNNDFAIKSEIWSLDNTRIDTESFSVMLELFEVIFSSTESWRLPGFA